MSLVLGIDSSTTATKAVLVDEDGLVVAAGSAQYPFQSPRPLWAEQSPEIWWEAAVTAVSSALDKVGGEPVAAVGLTGQMHGLVVLGSEGEVLAPAILWNDQRSGEECDLIRRQIGRDRLVRITGNDAATGFTISKLVWTKRHRPEVWAAIRWVCLPKDYLRYRLTGSFATDKADGSGTVLFDLANRDWSQEIVEELGIDPRWLPESFEGQEVTGLVTSEAAALTGLTTGTPVVAGGGDQAAGAVGVGAVNAGAWAVSLGTSGVVFAATETPVIEPLGRAHAFCHAVPERWHVMGVMLSAAGSLRWYRDTLAPGMSFDEVDREAASVPAGAGGLVFLPYLTGERTPHSDPLARGAWVGLTVRHSRGHLARSVLEGVAFGLADCRDLMSDAGVGDPQAVRVTGGGSASPLWRQIVADVLEAEVSTVNTTEGAAFGAAMLAAVGAGWAGGAGELADRWVKVGEPVIPGPAVEIYRAHRLRFRELYPALAPTFHALGG